MKAMVQLTILLATLLLLTGVASAQWCECYSVTCTNLDNGMVVPDHPVQMCFAPWDGEGIFDGFCYEVGDMTLFWDTRLRAIAYNEIGNPIGSLEFHGGIDGVTGIGTCMGDRWEFRGHEVDWEYCSTMMEHMP